MKEWLKLYGLAIAMATLGGFLMWFSSGCGGGEFGQTGFEVETDAATTDTQPDILGDTDAAKADGDVSPEAAIQADSDAATGDTDADTEADIGQDSEPTQETSAPEAAVPEAAALEASIPEASTPEACVAKTCADLGKNCGPVQDGCGEQLNCGSCPTNLTCGGDGVPGVCGGCVAKTCAGEVRHCGKLEDGCGNTLDCGPYTKGYDPGCADHPGFPHRWYCSPEQDPSPPPFPGCVQDVWPGSFCCNQ